MNKNRPARILKSFVRRFYKPLLEKYLGKERSYRYRDVYLKIFPGVFHPGFFFSTKILLGVLESFDLKDKTLLELGAGSGLIAIHAAKKGAIVTATDISKDAIKNISVNKELNHVAVKEIQSDLFDSIPPQVFDFVVINPPYYKGKIIREADYSWYAGEQLDYFQKLFGQLRAYIHETSHVLMILSDDCDIGQIQSLAAKENFRLKKIHTKKVMWETNFIFELRFDR